MKSLYFSLTSLILAGSVFATEIQDNLLREQSNVRLSPQISAVPNWDLKQDELLKHSPEAVNLEVDKKSLQQEVKRYTDIVNRLELANGKIPETIKAHYREYKGALEKLMEEVEHNPQINIKEELFFITQKHNMFSGGY